jgi:hypothetical protein
MGGLRRARLVSVEGVSESRRCFGAFISARKIPFPGTETAVSWYGWMPRSGRTRPLCLRADVALFGIVHDADQRLHEATQARITRQPGQERCRVAQLLGDLGHLVGRRKLDIAVERKVVAAQRSRLRGLPQILSRCL